MKKGLILFSILISVVFAAGCEVLDGYELTPVENGESYVFSGETTYTYFIGDELPDYTEIVSLKNGDTVLTIDEEMIDSSNVDLTTVGTYELYFSYKVSEDETVEYTVTITVLDRKKPVVLLTGEDEMTIEVMTDFIDPGYIGYYTDGIEAIVVVKGEVNTSVVGEYELTYEVVEGEVSNSLTRTIHVVDTTGPTIHLNGSNMQYVHVGDSFVDYGVTTTDNYDTDIEVIVQHQVNTNIIGEYEITYQAVDDYGNLSEILDKKVIVTEMEVPSIDIVGGNNNTIEVFSTYQYPEVNVYDDYYSFEDGVFLRTGDVDTNTIGDYEVTYTYTDEEDNVLTKILTVHVVDTENPVITLNGNEEIFVKYYNEFDENGYTVSDNYDQDLEVKVTENFDYINGGTIIYEVIDSSGNKTTVERIITIIDDVDPVINLVGNDIVIVEIYDEYTDEGATIEDAFDSNPTLVTSGYVDAQKVGQYTMIYTGTDASGNETVVTRTVFVVDTEAPVITLNGDEEIVVEYLSDYIDQGATASDNYDIEVTVTTHNLVDTSVLDSYLVTYSAVDEAGNKASTVTRKVIVVDTEAPSGTQLYESIHLLSVKDDLKFLIEVTDNYGLAEECITGYIIYDDQNQVIEEIIDYGTYNIKFTLVDINDNHTDFEISIIINDEITLYESFEDTFDFDYIDPSDLTETSDIPIEILFTEEDDMIICTATSIEFYDGEEFSKIQYLASTHTVIDCRIVNNQLFVLNRDNATYQDVNLYVFDLDGTRVLFKNTGTINPSYIIKLDENGNVYIASKDANNNVFISTYDNELHLNTTFEIPGNFENLRLDNMLVTNDEIYITFLDFSSNPTNYIFRTDLNGNVISSISNVENSRFNDMIEYNDSIIAFNQMGVYIYSKDLLLLDFISFDCYTFYTDAVILDGYLYLATATGGNTCSMFDVHEQGGVIFIKISLETNTILDSFYIDNRIFNDVVLTEHNGQLYLGVKQYKIVSSDGGMMSTYGYYKFDCKTFMTINKTFIETSINNPIDISSLNILSNMNVPLDDLQYSTNVNYEIPGIYNLDLFYFYDSTFYKYSTIIYVNNGGDKPVFDCDGVDTIYLDFTISLDNLPIVCTAFDTEDGDITSDITYEVHKDFLSDFDLISKQSYTVTYQVVDSEYNVSTITLKLYEQDFQEEEVVIYTTVELDNELKAVEFYDDEVQGKLVVTIENINGDGYVKVYDKDLNLVRTKIFEDITLYNIKNYNNELILTISDTTNEYFTNHGLTLDSEAALRCQFLVLDGMLEIQDSSSFYHVDRNLRNYIIEDGVIVEQAGMVLNIFEFSGDYNVYQVSVNEFDEWYQFLLYEGDLYITGKLVDDGNYGPYEDDNYVSSRIVVVKMDYNGNIEWYKTMDNGGYISDVVTINGNIVVPIRSSRYTTVDNYSINLESSYIFFDTDGNFLTALNNKIGLYSLYATYNGDTIYGYGNMNYFVSSRFIDMEVVNKYYYSRFPIGGTIMKSDGSLNVVYQKIWDTYDGLPELGVNSNYVLVKFDCFTISIDSTATIEDFQLLSTVNNASFDIDEMSIRILNEVVINNVTYRYVAYSYGANTFVTVINEVVD